MAARVEPRKVPLTGEVSSGSLGCRGHVRGRHCESARRIVAAQPTPSRLLGAHFADLWNVNFAVTRCAAYRMSFRLQPRDRSVAYIHWKALDELNLNDWIRVDPQISLSKGQSVDVEIWTDRQTPLKSHWRDQ